MLSRILWRWQPITTVFRSFHQTQIYRYRTGNVILTQFNSIVCMGETLFNLEEVTFPITTRKNEKNLLLTNIKSASSSFELFDLLSQKIPTLSATETFTVLETLFALEKSRTSSRQSSNLLRNPDFERLCQSLKKKVIRLPVNHVIGALKMLSVLGVKSSSDVMTTLLNQLKFQISDVSLANIVFLDFLLNGMESNSLVDALKLALPKLFEIQVNAEMDHENRSQLTDLLYFVSRNKVSDRCTMNVVIAFTTHGLDLSIEEARHVIWSLSRSNFRFLHENCGRLLANAIEVMKLKFDNESFDLNNSTLSYMVTKYDKGFYGFYDEGLYNKFAESVVNNDLGFKKATFIQSPLNKLNFVNMELLKYMVKEVTINPESILQAQPFSIYSFVNALSQANYKPDNWDDIYPLILRSELMTRGEFWIQLANDLLLLDVECPPLWNKIFSIDHLNQYLQREKHHFDLRRLLDLYQNIKVLTTYNVDMVDEKYLNKARELQLSKRYYPLKNPMETAFGGSSYVYTKVKTHLGQLLDHAVLFDKHTKKPVRISNDQNNYDVLYDDIKADNNETQCVAVMSFPSSCYCKNLPILRGIYALKLRTYEKMGIPVAVINYHAWSQFPSSEKIPYLERQIRSKL